jgi:5-methylcytosine-specific restriction endonuclease McrA
MYKQLGPKIIVLRNQGKSYDEIKAILGCSKGTICFHLGPGQKDKHNKRQSSRRAKKHPYQRKIENFCLVRIRRKRPPTQTNKKLLQTKIETFFKDRKQNNMYVKPTFSIEDVINKVSEAPVCYLTGKPIDIYQPRSYNFDHIHPVSRGGENTIDNLAVCTKDANQAKGTMTVEEFLVLCKQVLQHNGYKITKT